MKKFTCASFFAGVGGIDLGFEQTGRFETVYANDFDPVPLETMKLNFPNVKYQVGDIKNVNPNKDVPAVDVITGGFPCQAFSVAGYRKGFEDKKGRGVLFFDMLRIIKAKNPRIVFCENVKNLVGHDHGNTFRVITEALENVGYKLKYQVLNAMEYGNIPQNRERIYIVGFRNESDFEHFSFPEPIELSTKLTDIIDFDGKVNDKYYYRPGKYKGSIYEKLDEAMDDPNAIYQWRRIYVRKNKSGVVPTLTANQGEGGHNVCLVRTKNGIRKMTPHECFNTQGFPKTFKLPGNQADSRLYKEAGNSVCVSVIRRIAENIVDAMYQTDNALIAAPSWEKMECRSCHKTIIRPADGETYQYCPYCGEILSHSTV